MPYNLMSCAGFVGEQKESAIDLVAGSCIGARLGFVILFFVIAMIRKWGGEEVGLDFNLLFGEIFAMVGYLIMITLSGSLRFSLLVGLILGLLGGYGSGYFVGGDGE